MYRKVTNATFALVAAFLFFFAIAYAGWGCGGSILGRDCLRNPESEVTGALLLTAALIVLIAGIILILQIFFHYSWSAIAVCVLAVISAILSIAGIAYYADRSQRSSPFVATAAMTLTVALSVILIVDLVTKH
ncbi:hypothetical protein EGR_05436 [Echinococcus granulosus]|uniref:Uncharacterized protein n=1 Tax=Echinococcus granulosus TaxID=6210 RepID=U6JCY4_ECHGR|nr:hypothetical protein EGR_05436 [Echinococcus granulosus]EUB59674.1 hypothetical protein EGR_05436 [Echinococcus granulosus]CDS21946.1 hypothetical protein EgrG_000072300 [Echinococcus granulosus]